MRAIQEGSRVVRGRPPLVTLILTALLGVSACQQPTDHSKPTEVQHAATPVTAKLLASASEARGRMIYHEGSSPSGRPITAVVGSGDVPASLVACVNCHGRHGRGVPEGTLVPPDLTWSALTRPYDTVRRDSRARPPYTNVLITRAITLGVDSAGVALNAGMPRYRFSLEDCADLIAYLKRLGDDPEPGVTDAELRLGVILSFDADGMSDTVRRAVDASVETLNLRGGIYHRRVVVRFVVMPRSIEERPAALESFLNSEPEVFALISTELAGVDPSPAIMAEHRRIPLIAVCFTAAGDRSAPGHWAFSMLAGIADQSLALVRVARAGAPANAPIGIVHSAEVAQVSLARAIADRFGRANIPTLVFEAGGVDENAKALSGLAAIVLLGPSGRMKAWLSAVAIRGEVPRVIIPGALADRDLIDAPPVLKDRIALALPIDGSNKTFEVPASYRALVDAFGLPDRHRLAQVAAIAAAELVVEILERVGRELDRDRFVAALEALRDYRTGLAPPLTFGPNRRVGAPGAYPVKVDLSSHRLIPTGHWLDADGPLPSR